LVADGRRGHRRVRQRGQNARGRAVSQVEGGPEAGAAILQARGDNLPGSGDLPPGPGRLSSVLWVLGGPSFMLGAAILRARGGLMSLH
jgi:hypothetical protein